MILPLCHGPQSVRWQLKSLTINAFPRPLPALHVSCWRPVLILWQDMLILQTAQVTPNWVWTSKAASDGSSCFPGWAFTHHPLPASLLLPALLLCHSNTAVGTHCEFMRKDDLFSQCMKKYWVHEKSHIFQVLFREKEKVTEEEIRTILLNMHLLKKKNPWIMFSVFRVLLQTGKRGMFWRHISQMLRKEAEEGKRAQVFTTPGPVAALHYQNSSQPSAGRLPLPLRLYSDLGEKLHTAGGWTTPDLAVVVMASRFGMSCLQSWLFPCPACISVQEMLANHVFLLASPCTSPFSPFLSISQLSVELGYISQVAYIYVGLAWGWRQGQQTVRWLCGRSQKGWRLWGCTGNSLQTSLSWQDPCAAADAVIHACWSPQMRGDSSFDSSAEYVRHWSQWSHWDRLKSHNSIITKMVKPLSLNEKNAGNSYKLLP